MQKLSFVAELGRTRQYLGEYLDLYVRRFHEKTLDCCDPVNEEVLVKVCPDDIGNEYRVYLENLSFTSP